MSDIVELIDELNGNYWRHRKPKERVKRMKKTWMEKHPPTPESDGCEEEMDGEWNMDDGKVFLMGGGGGGLKGV